MANLEIKIQATTDIQEGNHVRFENGVGEVVNSFCDLGDYGGQPQIFLSIKNVNGDIYSINSNSAKKVSWNEYKDLVMLTYGVDV